MKRQLCAVIILAILLPSFRVLPSRADICGKAVPYYSQSWEWCWAANMQMVGAWHSCSKNQCTYVENFYQWKYHSGGACCDFSTCWNIAPTIDEYRVALANENFVMRGGGFYSVPSIYTVAEVYRALVTDCHPVIAVLEGATVTGGHAVTLTAIGYNASNPNASVIAINDPANGQRLPTYSLLTSGVYNGFQWKYAAEVEEVNCTLVGIEDISGFWYYAQDLWDVTLQCRLSYGTDPADSLALYVSDNPWGPARKVKTTKPLSAAPPEQGTVVNVRHECPDPPSNYYYWLDHGPGNFPLIRDPSLLDLYANSDNPVLYNTYYWLERDTLDAPDIASIVDPDLDDGHELIITWVPSEDDANVDFYNVYRKPTNESIAWKWLASVPKSTTSYTDSDLVSGTSYSYRISAAHHGNGLWNDFSESASGTPNAELQWGYIAESTTWSGNVHVDGDIVIGNGATLTVSSGTTVWVWPSEQKPNVAAVEGKVELCVEGGSLVINGTAQNPVKFQAWTNGGPVNRANNKWAGIWVGDSAPSSATINHAEIRNAARGLQARSPVTLTNSLIEDCKYIGVTIAGDSTNVDSVYVENSIIRRVRGGGIGVNALGKKAAIRLNSCVLDSCDMTIEVYSKAKLYTQQTTVKNSTYHGVKVYDGAFANLSETTVEGSALHAVKVFNGGTAVATSSTFKTSDYGLELFGSWGPGNASFTNCTFTGNEVGASVTQGGTLTASGCQFSGNSFEGVYCFNGADVSISTSTLSDNLIGLRADNSQPELTDNTLSGNAAAVLVENQGFPLLRRNKIWSNEVGLEYLDGSIDIDACNGSCPSTCPNANSIKLNDPYHVFNETGATVDVECTYWGGGPPGHLKVYGPIDYMPYLTNDPLPAMTIELPDVPATYNLFPNYPNPFNPTTTVALDVPAPGGNIQVRIYNVSGQLVKTLLDARRAPGRHELTWDGSDDRGGKVASGIYFLDMIAPEFHSTRKLVLIK